MSKVKSYDLNAHERKHLYDWYRGRAQHCSNCASAQKEMAEKYDESTDEIFISNPLVGERKTPENWLKRHRIFKDKANLLRRRAKVFAE